LAEDIKTSRKLSVLSFQKGIGKPVSYQEEKLEGKD
jgi:hypothetical protein